MKGYFTVGWVSATGTQHIALGVTSIVPNLNGILMFTSNRENIQIEGYKMADGLQGNMFIEYSDEDDIANYYVDAEAGTIFLHDCREFLNEELLEF